MEGREWQPSVRTLARWRTTESHFGLTFLTRTTEQILEMLYTASLILFAAAAAAARCAPSRASLEWGEEVAVHNHTKRLTSGPQFTTYS